MKNRKFVIVEQAGYEGETDVCSYDQLSDALGHLRTEYTDEERDPFHPDCLHVGVRQDWTDEDGTERQEYAC